MRRRTMWVLVVLGTALELGAAVVVVAGNTAPWVAAGGGLHLAAAWLCRVAARLRRPDLSGVETDIGFYTALLVPFFGPALAWALPRPPEVEEEANAHRVFEEYSDHVKPADPGYERTLFTGDYDRDLARELDAESYHSVLRHGSTDQKRNALRRLATLGEARHFELVRSCLLDPEHEVRLYAYSELERAGRHYEEEIARLSKVLKKNPAAAEAHHETAHCYFRYAASGIHDPQMAAFYFRSAEQYARQARQHGLDGPEPVLLRAGALAKLGAFDEAERCLGALPPDEQALEACCLTRAEIAFLRRDFAAVRVEVERLRATGADVPDWLKALEVHA